MGIRYFYQDLRKVAGTGKISMLKSFIFSHTIHLTLLLRLGQSLGRIYLIGRILSWFIEYVIRVLFSSDISCRSKIGPGLIIMHGHDIVIGADVVIGDNCKIFNGVTLGNKDIFLSSKGNQPLVGNNVVISTGAKILGALTIADNVIVGANAVVVKSCDTNSTYVGIPARKV